LTKPRARLDEVDRLTDRGVGRDAHEELVRAQAQPAHTRLERLDRTRRHLLEQMVDGPEHADRAVHELGDEATVARREPVAGISGTRWA
jgi:hypothetical protein